MKTFHQIFFGAVLFLSALLLFCACYAEGTEDRETGDTDAATTVTYTVTVTDEEGRPLSGVMLQLCQNVCVPGVTGENGKATFHLEKADYKVALITMPQGYAHVSDTEEFSFGAGKTELVVTLKKIG